MIPFFVMLIVGVICWNLANVYRNDLISQRKRDLQKDADGVASYLTSRINSRQAMLTGMAAMAKAHISDGLTQKEFNTYASGLKTYDPSIRAIQFFPLEGELLVYPLEGNEAVIDRTLEDLRTDPRPNVMEDVKRTIESRSITLSDPFELTQGGLGVVARLAVFDQESLLGLAVIVLNQDSLLDIPGLSPDDTDVRFALRDTHGNVFFGDEQVFFLDPVQALITLPEGSWSLGYLPVGGWEEGLLPRMVIVWSIGAVLVLLAGYMSNFLVNNQLLLKRTVEERTAALMESEARYTQIFKVINDGIWDWNIQNGTGFASENFSAILDQTHRGFNGIDDLVPYLHPADRERVKNEIRKGVKSGNGFNIQTRLLPKNHKLKHVLIRGRVVKQDSDGKSLRMLGTISDITEQMKAEDNLRESEAKFRAVFNNNHAVMLLIDPEKEIIIDANPAACEFYGYSKTQITSLKISAINTLNPDEIKIELQKAAQESRTYFDFQHRLVDGQIRDVEVFSGPITLEGRTVLFSIVHDITLRRQAEKAMSENENRLRFALEGANDGLWDVNMKTAEVYISPRGCEILGYTPAELPLLIQVWNHLVHPDDMPSTTRMLDAHLIGQSDIFEVEQRLHMKNGNWKWVLTRGKLVERDAGGKPLRMTGTHTDITHRKQLDEEKRKNQQELKRLLVEADASRQVLLSMLEDQKNSEEKLNQLNVGLEYRVRERTIQLETINNELEAFAYSVSHDLRAPLRGIDGWSLALLEDYGDQLDEKANLYLSRVRNETQRMGELIDDLLRLSRVTRMELKKTSVDLSQQARVIADRMREEFKENPPEFIIQSGIGVFADAQLLDIVLTNLISNACKFSAIQPSPRVEFGKTTIDGHPTYFVRDNGVGFDSANAKKLFGAFQRMHKQTEFPGTGIGLATVKRIINRHGGQVWAESQKNQGAIFFFTLSEVR
ncbi:MAG: PAS domain S-box protein [Anaerolineaceae bacterium]